jgi:hypothetical protein
MSTKAGQLQAFLQAGRNGEIPRLDHVAAVDARGSLRRDQQRMQLAVDQIVHIANVGLVRIETRRLAEQPLESVDSHEFGHFDPCLVALGGCRAPVKSG